VPPTPSRVVYSAGHLILDQASEVRILAWEHASAARRVVHGLRNAEVVGSSPTVGSMGDAQVCSAVLQTAPARFDTEVVHHARVIQLVEMPRLERGGWGFESLVGHACPVGPVWSGRRPVTAEIAGSSPVRDAMEGWPRGLRRGPAKTEIPSGPRVRIPVLLLHPVAACVVEAPR
jgi:hypothetical protein